MLRDFLKKKYGSTRGALKFSRYYLGYFFSKKYSTDRKSQYAYKRVVFLCSGNICRSALAEVIFRNMSSIPTCSFGLHGDTGSTAPGDFITAANLAAGAQLENHKSTSLNDFSPKADDLYVCMEPLHIKLLKEKLCLPKRSSIILLGMVWPGKTPYLHDPYNAHPVFKERISLTIKSCTIALAHQLSTKK